ncbi:MAG: ISL3 family transposase [Candidatus Methylomirabilis sp.]
MSEHGLFGRALGLQAPWAVTEVRFDGEVQRLDLRVDFAAGSRFPCPLCGDPGCPIHDTRVRTWRHLDFFQHQAFLTARVPRVTCPRCGVHQVGAPWAREGTGFTTSFEVRLLDLARQMPVSGVATETRVHPDSVWRVLRHHVEAALARQDLAGVTAVGLDECSKQKGHQYLTTFCDLDQARVIFVAEGKEAATVRQFAAHLAAHRGEPAQVTQICCDMAPAFISGTERFLPQAAITFDRYHVMALLNRAVDEVRRAEAREVEGLKATRYLWLKNPEHLTSPQRAALRSVKSLDLKTGRAYHITLALRRFWDFRYPKVAARSLRRWYFWATHSRLVPVIEAANAIRRHWAGVLAFIRSRITNGIVEGLNSKIKTALKRAYGFKTFENYRTIIYLIAGKLDLPTRC